MIVYRTTGNRICAVVGKLQIIKTLERFSDYLVSRQIDHVCYHGQLDRTTRRQVQNQFMRPGRCIALATNAFGMGIDKSDIRFVLHGEIPGSMESYYQEMGTVVCAVDVACRSRAAAVRARVRGESTGGTGPAMFSSRRCERRS